MNMFAQKSKELGNDVNVTDVAKAGSKARSTSIEMLKMDVKEQYTDIRIYHRLDDDGKPDFKPSKSGKCLMFGGRTANVSQDGANFFISASIGLRS